MDSSAELQLKFYDMLMRSQFWSAERMQAHQRSQLSQLLHHARAQVPFYATRLDAVFRADGEIDWDRWDDIPILTRADLQAEGPAMRARQLPPGHGPSMEQSSSGSTGTPVTTTQVLLTALASDAALARSHNWHGVDTDKLFLNVSGADPSKGQWPEGTVEGPWGPAFNRGHGESLVLNLESSPAEQLEFIQRHRPAYVASLPSRLSAIALEAQRQGVKVPVDAVLTRAEGASSAMRDLFRTVFGARTVEMYSTQEAARIAHDCPDTPNRHINAELVLVEIVDAEGHPCPAGISGRVILTPFFNTGQPLIRYEIGDLAAFVGPCSCGITLPVLGPVEGRISHLFRLPDGRRFVPNVHDDDMSRLGVQSWQLAQVSLRSVEFRYVAANALDEAEISSLLHLGLLRDLTLTVRRLEGFGLSGERKHISYRNEIVSD